MKKLIILSFGLFAVSLVFAEKTSHNVLDAIKNKDSVEVLKIDGDGKYLYRIGELKDAPNLKEIHILRVPMSSIPLGIYELTQVEKLTIAYCQLLNIPQGISNMKSLKYLNLEYGFFSSFPEDFTNLPNLEELHLEQCVQLTAMPSNLDRLKNLRILVFGIPSGGDTLGGTKTTPISSIDPSLLKMEKLEYLGLSCTNVQEFPEGLCGVKSLKRVTINFFLDNYEEVRKNLQEVCPGIKDN